MMFMLCVDYCPSSRAVSCTSGDGLVCTEGGGTLEGACRSDPIHPVAHYSGGCRPRSDVDFDFLQLGAVLEHVPHLLG